MDVCMLKKYEQISLCKMPLATLQYYKIYNMIVKFAVKSWKTNGKWFVCF